MAAAALWARGGNRRAVVFQAAGSPLAVAVGVTTLKFARPPDRRRWRPVAGWSAQGVVGKPGDPNVVPVTKASPVEFVAMPRGTVETLPPRLSGVKQPAGCLILPKQLCHESGIRRLNLSSGAW